MPPLLADFFSVSPSSENGVDVARSSSALGVSLAQIRQRMMANIAHRLSRSLTPTSSDIEKPLAWASHVADLFLVSFGVEILCSCLSETTLALYP